MKKKIQNFKNIIQMAKWDFDSLVDNHDLMEYIKNEKLEVFDEYNKYKQEEEEAIQTALDEAKKAKEIMEQEKMNASNQKIEEKENQLQEKVEASKEKINKLAAENKEFARAAKEFEREIKELKELVREKEEKIELIKLEKEKLENELKLCSGIKPSEDEDGIIAEFLNKFKNDVYKLEKIFRYCK